MRGPRLLTREETAQVLHVSLSTLDRTVRSGALPSVLLGYRTRRFHPDVIHEFARAGYPTAAKAAAGDVA